MRHAPPPCRAGSRSEQQEATIPGLARPDGDGRYPTFGEGVPVPLFAPAGLRSRREMWPARPWVDWTAALPAAGFSAIAMDQRNAGASRTEVGPDDGWHIYAADHLAPMDHLGFDRCHVLGGCIGASFCLKAIGTAPRRVACAMLRNPIGVHPGHPAYFPDSPAA